MKDEQWSVVWNLFETASQLDPNRRSVYLESASSDSEVIEQVLAMLEEVPAEAEARVPPVPSFADEWSQTGRSIGNYVVTAPLGRGGMGEVYSGRDAVLGRRVALKFLISQPFGSDRPGHASEQARFIREAQAASALNHPNIVTVHEVIRSEDTLAIVTELVEGRSLRELCAASCPPAQVLNLGLQIAEALAAAHSHGIVHRDVKPENIMVRPDGYVKVLDFGLARRVDGAVTSATGLPIGTLQYMSPEQLRGETACAASDVFAFGIVLSELATGVHPFAGASPFETVHRILCENPRFASQPNRSMGPAFESLIARMLSKEAGQRPSAKDLAGSLAACSPFPDPKAKLPARTRKKWLYAVTAPVAVVIALSAVAFRVLPHGARTTAENIRVVPLTGLAQNENQPAFSPDGRQVVFARNQPGENYRLYTKLIGSGPPLQLTATRADDFCPAWSPDGLQIAFLRRFQDHLAVMVMAALGGAEHAVGQISDPMQRERLLTWPAGQANLVVSDLSRHGTGYRALWLLPLDGMPRKRLTNPPPTASDIAPAFSLDGRLAFIRRKDDERADIFILEKAGEERRLTYQDRFMDSVVWMRDGRNIMFSSGRPGNQALWKISADGGQPARISELGGELANIALSQQGSELAYVRNHMELNIWKLNDVPAKRTPIKLIASAEMDLDPAYSPNGSQIAFSSNRSGSPEIWVTGNDGSNSLQLTSFNVSAAVAGSPRWSPDGTQIAFDARPKGSSGVFVVNANGGTPREVAFSDKTSSSLPAWSHNGRWIYFLSNRSGDNQIWKAPSGGGTAVQVTGSGGFESYASVDGKFLYYTKGQNVAGMWRIPTDGGEETEVPELRGIVRFRYWEGNKDGIYFLDANDSPTLKLFRFSTGRVTQVLSRVPPPVGIYRGLSVSPDGHSFLWAQYGSAAFGRIMLVENFR